MQLSIPSFGFGKSKSVVGLDIGSSSVKAVELAVKPKGFELLHLGMAHLPPEAIVQGAFLNSAAIVEAIKECLANARIKATQAAVAVSGHSVIVKKISLPAMSREELEESIRWEAEQYIPFDVNEVNLDFQILSSGQAEGQMDVLLVAAKKDLIDDYTHVLTDAGLQPVVMDVAAFAVENAYEASHEVSSEAVIALVNIGAQTANINILANGMPAFTRDISTGGNQFTEEIQKALSISFEEAERIKLGGSGAEESQEVVPHEVEQAMRTVSDTVIGEITRSLDFFSATSADSRIGRIVLAGGGSKVPGLDTLFHEKTNIPVERMNPLSKMLPSTKFEPSYLEEVAPFLGVGVGLALRRADER
ncbi:MAG TPA: type IV pilus assembly protein PilM [Myxococcota bacterium]|nr:type IV pilus assembly protein PilM [Myxococcota bacterium]